MKSKRNDFTLVFLAWVIFWLPMNVIVDFSGINVAGSIVLLTAVLVFSLLLGARGLVRASGTFFVWIGVIVLALFVSFISVPGELFVWIMYIAVVTTPLAWLYFRKRGLGLAVTWLLLLILALHAQWGMAQFFLQSDVNLRLLGESVLEIGQPGVATFSSLANESPNKFLRAYGPYSHPNILGGVLAIGVIVLANIWLTKQGKRMIVLALLAFFLVGSLVSFSRLSLFSIGISFIVFAAYRYSDSLKRMWMGRSAMVSEISSGGEIGDMIDYKRSLNLGRWGIFLISLLLMLVLAPLWWGRMNDPNDAAISERWLGYRWSIEIIEENSIWRGVGLGNYSSALDVWLARHHIQHEVWQVDSVHSAPLLIVAELGLALGLLVIVATSVAAINYLGRFRWWLIPMIPLLLFDHYLVTQPMGLMICLWAVLLLRQIQPHHLIDPD